MPDKPLLPWDEALYALHKAARSNAGLATGIAIDLARNSLEVAVYDLRHVLVEIADLAADALPESEADMTEAHFALREIADLACRAVHDAPEEPADG